MTDKLDRWTRSGLVHAAQRLGWDDVPVYVAHNLDDERRLLLAERDENTCRLEFAPTEAVAIGSAIEEREGQQARERQAHGMTAPGRNACGKFPQAFDVGKTRDKVGAALGMSGRTYQKAKAVVEAAETDRERLWWASERAVVMSSWR